MKKNERNKAVFLRSKGWSIKEISKKLKVAKSSVSRWVSHIVLNEKQLERLSKKCSLNGLRGALANKKAAKIRHDHFKKIGFDRCKKDVDFKVICALYWGEGKKAYKDVQITNSDTKMIHFFCKWALKNNLKFSFRVQFYRQKGFSNKKIINHWLGLVPELCFASSFKLHTCVVNRASQNKKIGKLPYGTGTVRVLQGTNFFYEIMGGIDYLSGA